jgi:hypothetical protein
MYTICSQFAICSFRPMGAGPFPSRPVPLNFGEQTGTLGIRLISFSQSRRANKGTISPGDVLGTITGSGSAPGVGG